MNSTRCKLPSLSSSWNDFPFSDSSDSEECNDIGVRWNIPWRVSCYKWVKSCCVDSLFARLVNFGFGIQHKVWATVSLRQDGLKYSWQGSGVHQWMTKEGGLFFWRKYWAGMDSIAPISYVCNGCVAQNGALTERANQSIPWSSNIQFHHALRWITHSALAFWDDCPSGLSLMPILRTLA